VTGTVSLGGRMADGCVVQARKSELLVLYAFISLNRLAGINK
jgi:hypothetical protein